MFSIQKGNSWLRCGYNKMYGGVELHIALFNIGFSLSGDLEVFALNMFIWKWNLSFYLNLVAELYKVFTIFYKHDDFERIQLF